MLCHRRACSDRQLPKVTQLWIRSFSFLKVRLNQSMNIQIKVTGIRGMAQKWSRYWTRQTEYTDSGTTVRFDWKKKITILYETHINAHRQQDVLFWRFTYHILYLASHLVCSFLHSFCVHAIYLWVLIFFRSYLLFPFLFVRSFNFSFSFFIMSFQPCLRHSLFPFFLLLSHSFISPLSFIYSCFYPSMSFPFSSPVSCILCSFLQLLLPSLSVTPCPIDQHRTWVPHALCLSCGHFTLIQYCRELMV